MYKAISMFAACIVFFYSPYAIASSKASSYPDFTQGDTRYGYIPNFGETYCGPVAVSNALIGLSENGYPRLSDGGGLPEDQVKMISELGSMSFMKTNSQSGTKPKNLVAGLERFVERRGYGIQVKTMGWRSAARRIARIPSMPWIARSTRGDSNVILNIGWYKYIKSTNTYQRTGGHYVTAVGFNSSNKLLLVHDPASRDGLSKKTLQCSSKQLKPSAKLRLQSGKTEPANGFFELDCLTVKSGNDLAIVDGAISFKVSK